MVYSDNSENILLFIADIMPLNEDEVLEDWTSIQDMNKADIYEGDIVRDSEETYTVEFGHSDFAEYRGTGWLLVNEKSRFFLSPEDCTVLEVIGNIHEHPHLLK